MGADVQLVAEQQARRKHIKQAGLIGSWGHTYFGVQAICWRQLHHLQCCGAFSISASRQLLPLPDIDV